MNEPRLLLILIIASLFYIWLGYPLVLFLLSKVKKIPLSKSNHITPKITGVSVIIAAYNEESTIANRIKNIMDLELPSNIVLNIYIGSDGSSDNTLVTAREYESDNIHIVDFDRVGRATMHNKLTHQSKDQIIIYTDAETSFDSLFVIKILEKFSNPNVGVVVGDLKYINNTEVTSEGESVYWKYEKFIRNAEEDLNILSNGTGAAMAIRKELYSELLAHEDVDTAIPIEAQYKNYRVVYAWDAIAYDSPLDNHDAIFSAKKRGTSQTMVSWLKRLTFSKILSRPGLFHSFLFHRFLKAATFILLVLVLFVTINILSTDLNPYISFLFLLEALFLGIYFIGFLNIKYLKGSNKILQISELLYDFVMSLAGMSAGLIMGIFGKAPATWNEK
jgi:poly-beta-1,6-N-acetyl-D-glucosamine synthase